MDPLPPLDPRKYLKDNCGNLVYDVMSPEVYDVKKISTLRQSTATTSSSPKRGRNYICSKVRYIVLTKKKNAKTLLKRKIGCRFHVR